MATTLSPAFVTLFEAEVHQAYQGSATLRNVARMRTGVEGSTAKFPILAKGSASVRTPSTDVVPLNGTFSSVTATLTDYVASEYSDIFNQAKINFDERQELAKLVGNAIGRREDQIIIDALIAGSAGTTVANTVVTSGSASASDLNVGKIIEAKKGMDAKSVPPTDRHMIIHANSLASLLGDERAISADFAQVQALVRGEVNSFMGFEIHMIGDRDEGGLPKDGSNDRTCLAFHRDAIGCAVGIPPKTEVNYIPEKTSFLVTAMYSAGAIVIDANGLVDITCRES
jgi:hypothetical protein|tara:strand:+ start:1289 stop:2143 length:855 start_codon:yes stop_codon:yes gene_type:complete